MAITKVSPGLLDLDSGITITVTDNSDNLTLVSTDADASVGPNLNLYRNSGSPADSDVLGVVTFNGRNDNSQDVIYARQLSYITDASDGTEDGTFKLQTMVGGTIRDRLNITPSEINLNEDSQDVDFRVESNDNANMLFVDGGNNRVGIAHSAPDANLHAIASANNTQMAFIIGNEDHTDNSTSQAVKMGFGLARDSGTVKNDAGAITVGKDAAWTSDDANIDSFMSFGTYTNNTLTEKLRLSSNVQVLANGGAVSTPTFAFLNDTNTGMTRPTGDTLQFVTGGSVRLRVNSTGLMFNSDTAAANALDDYEEGTWTPTFVNFGTGTYTHRLGIYTKIGNLVTVQCHLDVSDPGNASGDIQVSGFPFAALNSSNMYGVSSSVHGTSWSTQRTSLNLLLPPNATSTSSLFYGMCIGTPTTVSHADLGNGNLLFSVTYRTT